MLKKTFIAFMCATLMLPAIAADTTAPNPDPNAVKAAMNAIFSLLLDDDSGTSTTPPSGGTGGSGSGGMSTPGQVTLANFTTPHLNDPDAGTLPGELGVSNSGTATYSIPLVVPPGTASLQPSLSLNYNGSTQNGLLGVGWTLGGLSSIHRCGKTIAQDGVNERIGFTTADRLCLDGQRLILANRALTDENYWAEGAEYRTELESFSRITALGGIAARTFKLESKDGRIMTYGGGTATVAVVVQPVQSGADGKQPDAASKLGAQSWAIGRVQDRVGNYIRFEYTQDMTRGEHRPSVIRYGGMGASGVNAPHAAVHFSYDNSRIDKWKRYLDETRIDLVSRLNGIITYVGDNLDGAVSNNLVPSGWREVRRYNLAYEASQSSGRSLLKSVEACARGKCLPKTEFAWGQPDPSKAAGFTYIGNWAGAPVLTTFNPTADKWSTHHADYFAFSDFESDGFTDVLEKRKASPQDTDDVSNYGNPIPPGTLYSSYAYYHNTGQANSGFVKYSYGLNTGERFVVLEVGDFDGDGALDLLARTSSETKICLSPLANPAALRAGSFITFNCNSGLAAKGENTSNGSPYVVDVAGDGRSAHYTQMDNSGKAYLCSGNSCIQDADPPYRVLSNWQADRNLWGYATRNYMDFAQMVDYSGVGKPYDTRWSSPYFVQPYDPEFGAMDPYWVNSQPWIGIDGFRKPGERMTTVADYKYPEIPCTITITACTWYTFEGPFQSAGSAADFNGSGYNGLIFGYLEHSQAPGPRFRKLETTVCLSTGRALDCDVRRKFSGARSDAAGDTGYSRIQAVGNFIGDGAPSILVEKYSYATSVPALTGQLQMCRIIGDATSADKSDAAMTCSDWAGPALRSLSYGLSAGDEFYFMDLLGTGRTQLVKYRSGKFVNGTWAEDGRWEVYAPVDVAVSGQALDRIHRVTNGFGAVSTVEYTEQGAASQSNRVYGYPLQRTPTVGKIVNRLVHSNGAGISRTATYAYQDAATNMHGRGSAGFGKIISTDVENDIVTTREYSQVWPFVGQLTSERVENKGCALSNKTNSIRAQSIVQANGVSTLFPYLLQEVTQLRDWNCADLGTRTTTNTFEDAPSAIYGNLKRQETVREGAGNRFVTLVDTVFQDNATNWMIGLPVSVTKTQYDTQSSLTRKVAFAYDANGQVSKEIVEPDATGEERDLYRVETDYIRAGNTFGLVKEKRQTWKDKDSGQMLTRTVSDTTYDSRGRFPSTVKNALGHQESYSYDEGTGVKIGLNGPNGVATTWGVDGFGRVESAIQEVDGVRMQTLNYFKRCIGDCPGGARVVQVTEVYSGTSRTEVPVLVYSDSQGRVLTTETWGFDATRIRADKEYDSQGRLRESFKPAYLGQPRYSDVLFAYDGLGRVTSVISGGESETKTEYSGYRTVETNAKGYQRIIEKDAVGQVRFVIDANGKATTYSYDPFGNLTRTTDPNGNVTTVSYDRMGRKTDLRDPDLGWTHFDNDPLGRVWKQVSPNQRAAGQFTRSEYDPLGRMTARYEPDLESHWIYDTAANGTGLLAEAYTGTPLKKDYSRVHEYYSLGRPKQVTQKLTDGVYKQTNEYDAWNRLSAQVYRRNDEAAKRFDLRFNAMGYLERIERGNLVLWKATKQDASNRVTAALLGNGLLQTKVYNAGNDTLTSIQASSAGVRRVEVGYEYDKLRNVTKRTQYWETAGFSEDFGYDRLNRVSSSKVLSVEQVYGYNDDGGISSRTGVGSYTYPTPGSGVVRPHAVRNITGIGDFNYDDNGNLVNGAGRTAVWTSFDMPKSISNASGTSEFVYGPEHQRVRQDRGDGTQIVYAGPQEVVTLGSTVSVKTYWPNGIGLEIDRSGGPTELRWSHVDHLGSVVALTDEVGNVKERMSYDVWGKWRRLNASGLPIALDGIPDNSGYTGHEMLEQLDLVHMNGRIYDPVVGRFLSADPFVEDPLNGQSFNRYSYVMNNPTNRIDPTGFTGCGDQANGNSCDPMPTVHVPAPGSETTIYGQPMGAFTDHLSMGTGEGGMNVFHHVGTFGPAAKRQANAKLGGVSLNGVSAGGGTESKESSSYDRFSKWAHIGLSGAGAIPLFGVGADLIDLGLTAIEYPFGKSDGWDLGLGAVSILATLTPGPGDGAAAAAKMARRAAKVCNCCFAAGTPIMTVDGEVPIETVKVGQLVFARNAENGETELKPVTELIVTEQKLLYELVTLSKSGVEERLEVTDNHPFWVGGKGWVDAAKLEAGMELVDLKGEPLTVQSLRSLDRLDKTYNFTVADFHTYFAGKQRAFVHNCTCTKAVAYSVAFEAQIAMKGAGTRGSHFTDANKTLKAEMAKDAKFAEMMEKLGVALPSRLDQSPAGWSWHHVPDQPGLMQLVPRPQHQGSSWQWLLHPGQQGGFKLWGDLY